MNLNIITRIASSWCSRLSSWPSRWLVTARPSHSSYYSLIMITQASKGSLVPGRAQASGGVLLLSCGPWPGNSWATVTVWVLIHMLRLSYITFKYQMCCIICYFKCHIFCTIIIFTLIFKCVSIILHNILHTVLYHILYMTCYITFKFVE